MLIAWVDCDTWQRPPGDRHVRGSYHEMTRNAQYEWTWF